MQTGDILRGKYRLVRLLGDGGMGSVYEAHHQALGTRVAIKVLHPDLARRPGLVERFLREARVSAQIKSPNVVQVMDVERTEDGVAYIVMELLEGEALSSVLERDGKLSIPLACDYAVQVLKALEAAHALGVVHRDLKPENVFLTPGSGGGPPLLKLIDFGIAKARQMDSQARNLTVAGIVMGTPEYMAPEQAHSADKVDARSDIFAVGVMLYEMICGSRPVDGDDAHMVALRVERGEVRPLVHAAPGVPPDLAGLVHRAMAARPELRFATAKEMRTALEGVMHGKRVDGQAPPASKLDPHVGAASVRWQGGAPETAPNPALKAASNHPPPVAPSAHPPPVGSMRGTVMSDPSGQALRHPAHTPMGAPPPMGAYGQPAGGDYGGAWQGGIPPGPAPVPMRSRQRPGSQVWLLVAIPVLVGGGIVLAFAMSSSSGSSSPQPTPATTPAPVTVAPTPTTSAATPQPPAADNGAVPPLSPLNGPSVAPNPGPARPPGPGVPGSPSAKPHPSASASTVPSASPPSGTDPFPFPSGFPGIPNPFPSPNSSGVGPILTIPTNLPFPLPGLPGPAPSSAPAPSPAPSGKSI